MFLMREVHFSSFHSLYITFLLFLATLHDFLGSHFQTRDWTQAPYNETWNPSHWTTREVAINNFRCRPEFWKNSRPQTHRGLIPFRPWCWERLRAGGEGDDRGWDGWMASPTQWTWVWASSGRWWKTGKPGVLQSMGSQRHDLSDWTTSVAVQADPLFLSHQGRTPCFSYWSPKEHPIAD